MLAAEEAEEADRETARATATETIGTLGSTSPASDPLIAQAAAVIAQARHAPDIRNHALVSPSAEDQRTIAVRLAYEALRPRDQAHPNRAQAGSDGAQNERTPDQAERDPVEEERAPDADSDTPSRRILSVAEASRRLAAQLGLNTDPDPRRESTQQAPSGVATQTVLLAQPQPLRPGQASVVLRGEQRTPASQQQVRIERTPEYLQDRDTPILLRGADSPTHGGRASPEQLREAARLGAGLRAPSTDVPISISPSLAADQAATTTEAEEPIIITGEEGTPDPPIDVEALPDVEAEDVPQIVAGEEARAAELRAIFLTGGRERRVSESLGHNGDFRQRWDSAWGKGGPDDHRGPAAGGPARH
ncbi:hypothetical protein CC86DRAFT_411296 [Ophiobolus disseminans]|uniref:Uncharacterized protein n=1 Tax=Ophiobolus disseminans TaxID=1469910 RepID=A0A6A6ZKU9_9PLEO|nr:hypothetical protein CC86DRAFT_411296 [Ophiobolus disseminans]